jgi:hypothetical protein
MNKMFLLLHESYFDGFYDSSVYAFEKYEDGLFYLDEMKQKVIEDYLSEAGGDINYFINNDNYEAEIDDHKNYFFIYLEEFGWDRLSLEESDILKF